jgi:hypothetical protein
MNLTVKEVTKRTKKGGGKKGGGKNGGGGGGGGDEGEGQVRTRLKLCPSFFRFFEASGAGGGAASELDRLLAPEIEETADKGEEDAAVRGQVSVQVEVVSLD